MLLSEVLLRIINKLIRIARFETLFGYYAGALYPIIPDELLIKRIKNRISKKRVFNGHSKLRIFIAVKNVNWEQSGLVDTWQTLGEVLHYDWGENYNQYSNNWHIYEKERFNFELVDRVTKAHKQKSITLFFSYLSGRWVFPETIWKIDKLGIITINFSFDDSHIFWGSVERTGWSGNAKIARYFDVNITSQSRKDISKYLAVGAIPIFLPPGSNKAVWNVGNITNSRNIPVVFIGKNYGKRERIINYLRSNGVKVFTWGLGWPGGPITQGKM